MKLFLALTIFFVLESFFFFGTENEKTKPDAGCNLQDYLVTFDQMEDYQLQEDMLNLDTLHYEFEPRHGYFLTVVGFIKLDTLSTELTILVDKVKIYGGRPEGFNNKGIELYFKNQFEGYIYALTEEFELDIDSLKSNCSFAILLRKYRNCG